MVPRLKIENECSTISHQERRASGHLRCEAAITCTHFDLQCHPKTHNISETGLCFHTEFAMQKGLFIHVRIDNLSVADFFPKKAEFSLPTAAAAQVIRCRKIPAVGEYEIGVKFLVSPRKKAGLALDFVI